MKKISLAIVAAVILTGCTPTQVSSTPEEYIIVGVKPPKRLYVTVVDPKGRQFQVYVAKRCGTWKEIKIGTKVTLNKRVYKTSEGFKTTVSVYRASDICPARTT